MRKSRFTDEQIAYAIRQVEQGTPASELCRRMGISEQTFYTWKRKYAGMGVAELKKVKQLEDEDRRLKGLVADLTLDKHSCRRCSEKNSEAHGAPGTCRLVRRRIPGQPSSGLRTR